MLEGLGVKPIFRCVINSYVAEGGSQLIYARFFPSKPSAYPGKLCSRAATSLCAIFVIAAAWSQSSSAPQPSVNAATPSLPLPGAFAPAPFALPGSRQAAQKQLCSLIRKLDPVQTADLLVTGDDSALNCRLLLTCRPGRRMTAATLETMAHLCTDSIAGLEPQRLSILDTKGRVLYRNGKVEAAALPAPVRPHPLPWLLVACGFGVIGMIMALQGRRASRARPHDFWDELTRHQQAQLLTLLLRERPETIGVLLANLPPPLAERLRGKLRRHRVTVATPLVAADAQVVEIVRLSLQRQLRGS